MGSTKHVVFGAVAAALFGYSGVSHAAPSGWSYNIPSSVSSYWDSTAQKQYVFYIDAWGNTQAITHVNNSPWTVVTIAAQSAQFHCGVGTTMAAYYDGGTGHLYCLAPAPGGDLLEFEGSPPTMHADITNISTSPPAKGPGHTYTTCEGRGCLENDGWEYPGSLAGYFVPSGNPNAGAHIFYTGNNDASLHEAVYASYFWTDTAIEPGYPQPWAPGQLYASSGQGMAALWDGSAGHVYYIDDDVNNNRNLIQAYNTGTGWATTYLATWGGSGSAGYVPQSFLVASSPQQGYQTVLGAPLNGNETYSYKFTGTWTNGTMNSANLSSSGPMVSYTTGSLTQYFYVDTNGHVHDYVDGIDLTTYTGALAINWDGNYPFSPPPPELYCGYSKMTGFWDGACRHVFYIATDSHIHEMYSCESSGASWYEHDLFAGLSPAPTPAAD